MQDDASPYPVEDWDHWATSMSTTYPTSHWKRYETPEQAGWSASALIDAQRFSEGIGSAAVMVVFGGAVLAHWGQVERRYYCHSMRKSILSALYGEPVTQGTVDLEETLASIGIDDDPPLTEIEKSARVADLLKSRSGIYLPAAYEDEKARNNRPARGSHEPGSHWHYNNWDFNVLATIFNRKTGGDVFEAFHRRLAMPLQMQDFELHHGHYHFEAASSIHPAYPFRMSARDLARFGLLYLQEGKWNDVQIVPPSWVLESTRSHSTSPDYGYGYMWWTEGGHRGQLGTYFANGVGHRLYVIPRAQLVIVHRSDTYLGGPVSDANIRSLVDKILSARLGQPASQPRLVDMPEPQRPKVSCDASGTEFVALCGEYAQNGARVVVRQMDNRLELQMAGGRFYLFRRSPTEFDIEDMPHRLEFVLDETGKAGRVRMWRPFEMSKLPTSAS
jgi:CubicO group peptidase (beta-lactamase class C family)